MNIWKFQKFGTVRKTQAFNKVKRMDIKYIPGDLVMADGPNTIYKIDSIESKPHTNDFIYTLVPAGIGAIIFDLPIDFICPVPLTPKILSANSFKIVRQDESGALYFKEGLGIDIVDSYVRNCYDICISGNKILRGIKYCHQLQHFLFGLGLNSEMEV